jgi:hypothetical protein
MTLSSAHPAAAAAPDRDAVLSLALADLTGAAARVLAAAQAPNASRAVLGFLSVLRAAPGRELRAALTAAVRVPAVRAAAVDLARALGNAVRASGRAQLAAGLDCCLRNVPAPAPAADEAQRARVAAAMVAGGNAARDARRRTLDLAAERAAARFVARGGAACDGGPLA